MIPIIVSPPGGGGSSSNASVGTTNATAPTSATELGYVDGTGKLQAVSPTNPLPVNVTIESITTSENLAQVNGATVNVGTGASGSGTQRVAVASDSTVGVTSLPSIPAGANTIGSIANTSFAATQATASALNATVVGTGTFATQVTSLPSLPAGSNAIGSITNTSFIATQSTASNLNAMVTAGDYTATGSITTQNLVPAGTATAGSAVAIPVDGKGTVTIQVTGVYTGALSPQVTTDGVNWITQTGFVLQNMNTGTSTSNIPSAGVGIWQIEVNGHAQMRITALAAVTGTATITMRAALGTSQVSIGGVATAANQTAVIGSVGAGTAAASSELTGGVYNTTLPTMSNGQQAAIQLDSSGRQIGVGAGVAGTPAGGVMSVQGVTNGTALPVVQSGRVQVAQVFLNMSSTNVTTAAYVQLLASTGAASTYQEIFVASGEVLQIGVGGAGSEVVQYYTFPGGQGSVPLTVPSGSRIAVKALSNNVTAGYLVLNLYA